MSFRANESTTDDEIHNEIEKDIRDILNMGECEDFSVREKKIINIAVNYAILFADERSFRRAAQAALDLKCQR
jgi:hypothetical protein